MVILLFAAVDAPLSTAWADGATARGEARRPRERRVVAAAPNLSRCGLVNAFNREDDDSRDDCGAEPLGEKADAHPNREAMAGNRRNDLEGMGRSMIMLLLGWHLVLVPRC